MSRYDASKHELQLMLSASSDTGIWASSIMGHRKKHLRTAGQLPHASGHTLLAVSLVNALSGVSKAEWNKLLETSATPGIKKPRVSIATTDTTFAPALQGKMRNVPGAPVLKTGRNFLMELARQLARFEISFDAEPDGTGVYILSQWAHRSIREPKEILPAAFQSMAVSEMV